MSWPTVRLLTLFLFASTSDAVPEESCPTSSCSQNAKGNNLLQTSQVSTRMVLDSTNPTLAPSTPSSEDALHETVLRDIDQIHHLPDPSASQKDAELGMGSLGVSMEFVYMKLAQLETAYEITRTQSAQLHAGNLETEAMLQEHKEAADHGTALEQEKEKVRHRQREGGSSNKKHGTGTPHQMLLGTIKKHAHQRKGWQAKKTELKSTIKPPSLGNTNAVKATESGKVSLMANAVNKDVFDDLWAELSPDAGCSADAPSLSIDEDGFRGDFGAYNCWLEVAGSRITLFDFDFGSFDVDWFGPIKAVIGLIQDIDACTDEDEAGDMFTCIATSVGKRMLEIVPPFSFIHSAVADFLPGFIFMGANAIKSALASSTSLIQEATLSKFPDKHEGSRLHHASKNLAIRTRSRELAFTGVAKDLRSAGASLLEVQGALNTSVRQTGIDEVNMEDAPGYVSQLITQWGGRETDTGSCLSFAPAHRREADGTITERDWQVPSESSDWNPDVFVKLEPWAVPCDNEWMKDNPTKWQGYSFYRYQSPIELCVIVSIQMGMEPVAALVGGLEFELLPAPLVQLDMEVCWPDGLPDGQCLTMASLTFTSGGIPLLKHVVRLSKRFGDAASFSGGNIQTSRERARASFGAGDDTDDGDALRGMEREALLEESEFGASLAFDVKQEDVLLGALKYDAKLGVNITQHLTGPEAARRLKAAFPKLRTHVSLTETIPGDFPHEFFDISNDFGFMGFTLKGQLNGGIIQLVVGVALGPLDTGEKTLDLIDVEAMVISLLEIIPTLSADCVQSAVGAVFS